MMELHKTMKTYRYVHQQYKLIQRAKYFTLQLVASCVAMQHTSVALVAQEILYIQICFFLRFT